jgi:protein TonB
MMQPWRERNQRSATIGTSAMVSVVAHVALIALAIGGTDRTLQEAHEDLVERATYLHLPPDRSPAQERTRAELQRLSLGTPLGWGKYVDLPTGQSLAGSPVAGDDPLRGLDVGNSDVSIPELPRLGGYDSVYSVLDVDSSVVRDPLSAAPAYPEPLREQSLSGSVLARYVVDTTGRADMTSFVVVRSTHPLFTAAVREALPQSRFTPAKIGQRVVRQLVEQEFYFRLSPAVTQASKPARTPPTP